MKILIADAHPEVQDALQLILCHIPEVSGVNAAASFVQLLAICVVSCPDLILLDINLLPPPRSHSDALLDTTSVLRRLCPCSLLVLMSSRFEVEQEAQRTGADGFISKTAPPDEVLASLASLLKRQT